MSRMHRFEALASAGALALAAFASTAAATETAIRNEELPAAVSDAVQTRFPGAILGESEMETLDGRTSYEVELTLDGRQLDARFREDGTLALLEEQISEAMLPSAAVSNIRRDYRGATILGVDAVRTGPEPGDVPDYYQIDLRTAAGKTVELTVAREGAILRAQSAETAADSD